MGYHFRCRISDLSTSSQKDLNAEDRATETGFQNKTLHLPEVVQL